MGDCLNLAKLIPNTLSYTHIAKQMNLTQQCVSVWIKKNEVPPRRVPEFSRITGIPKSKLNPLFSDEVAHG
ncbi:hypothetical protein D5018_03820 [Parashewanella curva]|uniref:Helix-turn-helix domain-containing protein n=1 Tax=Parashewanella curva TaxID=2338552 RepID=A0A3L8Q1V4_9GAMM|nr:hypothetical protein D5018_03820 [Parashewanella curva]